MQNEEHKPGHSTRFKNEIDPETGRKIVYHKKAVSFKLPIADYELLAELANVHDMNPSQMARQILLQYLRNK